VSFSSARPSWVVPALALAAGVLTACVPATANAPAAAKIVRIGWAGSPDSLNPGVGVLNKSYVVYQLV